MVFPFKDFSEGLLLAAPSVPTPISQPLVPSIPVVQHLPSIPAPITSDSVPAPISVLVARPAPSASKTAPTEHPLVVNNHNMRTRAKAVIREPKVYAVSLEPKSAKEALTIPHWKQAMDEEFAALMKNKTWELVPLPSDRTAIGSKWVFRVKYHPDGSISKYKARL